MALTTRQVLNQSVVGLAADAMSVTAAYNGPAVTQATSVAECTQAIKRRRTRVWVTDGGTAGTAALETPILVCPATLLGGMQIIQVSLLTQIAITANNTTYATFTLAKRSAAGATSATVAVNTTAITDAVFGSNATAFTQYVLTNSATAANMVLASGNVLTFALAKASTGVAIASATGLGCCLEVEYEEL